MPLFYLVQLNISLPSYSTFLVEAGTEKYCIGSAAEFFSILTSAQKFAALPFLLMHAAFLKRGQAHEASHHLRNRIHPRIKTEHPRTLALHGQRPSLL